MIELKVGGAYYGGWTKVSIDGGIEQIAGSFSIGLTEKWPGQDTPRPIRRGEQCQVLVNGTPVITGYVDTVVPEFDSRTYGITVTGRDATGDLVDCSAIHKSGQWAGADLGKIVRDICTPFGIKVTPVNAGAVFSTFSLQEGETAYEAIERACRMRAVMPASDGLGGLVLTRANAGSPVAELIEGENILDARGEFSNRERYSEYRIKGQDRGDDFDFDTPENHTQVMATARDELISRYRPLIVLAEERGPHATYQERAEWERNVRRGRSAKATISVTEWTHKGGLWQPNTLVRVRSQSLGVDADLLVTSRSFILDERGRRTTLTVAGPEAFDLLAGLRASRLDRKLRGKRGAAQRLPGERKKDKSGDWSTF